MSFKNPQPGRLPHYLDGRIVAKAGLVRTAILGTATLLTSALSHAQTAPCGLTSMQETTNLAYPPIARAAHVDGPVVFLATFNQDGVVQQAKMITGPKMLELAATTYIKGLHANRYTGPRRCPIVITFKVEGGLLPCDNSSPKENPEDYLPRFKRIDLQHVTLTSRLNCLTVQYEAASLTPDTH